MWLNWLIFFEKLAIPNLPVHLFAEDEATYVKCQQLADEIDVDTKKNESSSLSSRYRADLTCLPWNFAFYQDTVSNSIGATTYGSRGYKTMMSHRPAIIQRELELGKSVIFSDVDVVWKKDPLPYLDAELKSTFENEEEIHVLAQDYENGGLCPGFMIYFSCPSTISFVEQWRAELDGKNSRNQVVFNKLLEKNPNFVARALPLKLFVNGGLYSKEHKMTDEERELAVVVHNNYIAGYDEKLDRFKKWGLWALDDGRVTQKTKK